MGYRHAVIGSEKVFLGFGWEYLHPCPCALFVDPMLQVKTVQSAPSESAKAPAVF